MQAGRTTVFGWHVQNPDAANAYLHLYDAAAAANVTVGTTVPDWTLWLPPSGGVDTFVAPGDAELGLATFNLGVVIAATTTVGGSTDPTSGELVNLSYV